MVELTAMTGCPDAIARRQSLAVSDGPLAMQMKVVISNKASHKKGIKKPPEGGIFIKSCAIFFQSKSTELACYKALRHSPYLDLHISSWSHHSQAALFPLRL